jgi:hypothetical protein
MMPSTYLEPEDSSSRKRLYMQVWYSMFKMHQYKHVKHTIPYMYVKYNSLPEDEPSDLKHVVEDILN